VNRHSTVFSFLLLAATKALAQQPCTPSLPVSVYMPDGALIRKLEKNQFEVKSKQGPVPILSVSSDRGPRRIVFVVETGTHVNSAARIIESKVIGEIVAETRPEEALGLLTARGSLDDVALGADHGQLAKAALALEEKNTGPNRQRGVLDALAEAVRWLQPSQPGDAIVVMTMGIERDDSRTSFKKIRDELASRNIRLFGFHLGMMIAGSAYTTIWGLPGGRGFTARGDVEPNEQSLTALGVQSGGFVFVESTERPQNTYHVTDERLVQLQEGGGQIYKAIEEYYLLKLEKPVPYFKIDLSEEVREKLPRAMLAYPRKKNYCLAATKM
jgi:hypothetical protein